MRACTPNTRKCSNAHLLCRRANGGLGHLKGLVDGLPPVLQARAVSHGIAEVLDATALLGDRANTEEGLTPVAGHATDARHAHEADTALTNQAVAVNLGLDAVPTRALGLACTCTTKEAIYFFGLGIGGVGSPLGGR